MSIYVSASGLRDFISCSRKAYYRIYKPVPPVKNIDAVRGTLVHKALQLHWKDLLDADKYLQEQCSILNLPKEFYDESYWLVRAFFDTFYPYVGESDLLEHNFKIKLDSGAYLVGVLDRVSSGKVFDWKTGKKTPSNLSNDIQFILYNYAYKKVFNSEPVGLYYASLRDKKLVMYKEDKLFTDVLFNDIIPEYIEKVSSKSFERTGIFNGGCYRCDWKSHCLSKEN